MPFAVRGTIDTVMRKKQMKCIAVCRDEFYRILLARPQTIRNCCHHLAAQTLCDYWWCIQCCSIDSKILCVLRGRALIYMLFPIPFSVQCMTANRLICVAMAMAMPANCRCSTSFFLLKLDSPIHSNRKFLQTKTDRKQHTQRGERTPHTLRFVGLFVQHMCELISCKYLKIRNEQRDENVCATVISKITRMDTRAMIVTTQSGDRTPRSKSRCGRQENHFFFHSRAIKW